MDEMIPKYLESPARPFAKDGQGAVRECADNYGDVECPFCDHVICPEGKLLKVGDKCPNCPAVIVELRPAKPST